MDNDSYYLIIITILICLIGICGIIANILSLIVATRPGFTPSNIPQWVLDKVHFANIPQFEISSTNIRARWREDKTIRYMVTKEVWDFINKDGLY